MNIHGSVQRFEVTRLLNGVDLERARRSPEDREWLPGELAEPLRVFVSYSQKDTVFLDQLLAALVPYERRNELSVWCDAHTEPGQEWEREILGQLERAHIVILLLSKNFFQSVYCMEKELQRALERREHGECEVIPIVVRTCRYTEHPIGKLQAIQLGKKSNGERPKPGSAWKEVTKGLDKVIKRIRNR